MKLYAGTTEQRRLDAMLTSHSPTSAESAVVVELKPRSDGSIGPSGEA
jgi:hypothetical protein